MTILFLFLATLGCLIVLRSVLFLVSAEIGRKQDLIKHIYKSGTDFQIAIVIPYLDTRKLRGFQDLIQALDKQDYPSERARIHVVTTEEAVYGLPEVLPEKVKIWTYPARHAEKGVCTTWLIERLLAAGGPSKLFVFLDADNIVRPDFLRNVTTRAFDCFAMQGYVALKRPPKDLISTVSALSTRLLNRIENAGRFHLGLSCRLMSTGWMVRQEILEMIPFKQGSDFDNLEYTVLLNLNGYRINWAPNVVVYREEKVDFPVFLREGVLSLVNRSRLTLQYLLRLLAHGVTRLDLNSFEQAWSIVKPSHFLLGLLGLASVVLLWFKPAFPGSVYYAAFLVVAFWTSQLMTLAVARCNMKDVLVFLLATPLAYLAGLALVPMALANVILETFMALGHQRPKSRIGKRFDERQPARTVIDPNSLDMETRPRKKKKSNRLLPIFNTRGAHTEPLEDILEAQAQSDALISVHVPPASVSDIYVEEPAKTSERSEETVYTLPISNGQNTVSATFRAVVENPDSTSPLYHLVFEYKSLAFTTQKYRMLDQAYYELLTKLQSRQFTTVSCGSCAYFYRSPVEEGASASSEFGHCMFGKQGQPIESNQDWVTVLSSACQHYADMAYREAVVSQWQNSLHPSPLSASSYQ